MADFLAYRIIIGKLEYADVPESLKATVKKVLIESDCADLAQ